LENKNVSSLITQQEQKMARGKYSPTVNAAYAADQEWHTRLAQNQQYDPDGYDSYGYDRNDVDRAGNNEFDYLSNDLGWESDDDINWAYNDAHAEWTFDGQRPVKR
jgi:hypothetical protein